MTLFYDGIQTFSASRDLSAVGKHYLSTPVTSVASERVFSVSVNIATAKSSCRKVETVELLTFLNENQLLTFGNQ